MAVPVPSSDIKGQTFHENVHLTVRLKWQVCGKEVFHVH